MLRTSITKPQVEVTVDGLEGACANINCDYEYVTPQALITSQSIAAKNILIAGTNLPTTGVSLVFGGAPCIADTIDA